MDAAGPRDRGRALARRGLYAEAEAAFRDALAVAPDLTIYLDLATVLRRQRRAADAEVVLRAAVAANPAAASAHPELGGVLFELHRYEDAVAVFSDAVRLRPDFARAWFTLGLAHERRGDFPNAEAALREALRLKPSDDVIRTNLGTVLRRQRRTPEAEALHRDGLRAAPTPASLMELGRALFEQRRWDEAAERFRAVIALAPRDARAHLLLGLTLERGGRRRHVGCATGAPGRVSAGADACFPEAFSGRAVVRPLLNAL